MHATGKRNTSDRLTDFLPACMVYNPNYDFEDRNIPVGAAFWVALKERFLA